MAQNIGRNITKLIKTGKKIKKNQARINATRSAKRSIKKGQRQISELEGQGYVVPENIKQLFYTDKKSFTRKQADRLLKLTKKQNIAEKAYIPLTIPQPGTLEPMVIKLRHGQEMEDLSKRYVAALKRGLKEKPSRSMAHRDYLDIKRLEDITGAKLLRGTEGKTEREIRSNLLKYLPSSQYLAKTLGKIDFSKTTSPSNNEMEALMRMRGGLEYLSNIGAISAAAQKENDVINQMTARGINRANAVRLIDFFMFSKQWQRYREMLVRGTYSSEEAVNAIDEALEYVEDMGGSNSIQILDMEMSKGGDIDEVIGGYLEWIIESME